MKKISIALLLLALAGCQVSDQEILADIAVKAQQDLNFAGLHYTARNGIVNFTGFCPSEKSFAKIKQTIKGIHIIKAVYYQVSIAPVTLNAATPVKLQADSILANYPQVTGKVDTTGVVLTGKVTAVDREKLMKAFASAHIASVTDNLTIQ